MTIPEFFIPYGSGTLPLALPCGTVQLRGAEPRPVITPELFKERLALFWQENPLDLSRPVLVVADKTRLCGYPEYLPILIEELAGRGLDQGRLRVLIAYGTHPRQSDEECLRAYGDCYRSLAFMHHDCRERQSFVDLGHTRRGTPIRLRRDLAEASAIIAMGAVSHHYFAGYGGGRKLIFPGLGEREAIYANHALYLDRATGTIATGCRPGNLADNPLAEDLFEVEEARPADLAIHGILNSHGILCDLLPGRGREIFLKACAAHGASCETTSRRFPLVVASCGGYPKDINFIQSHKAVHNAAMFVEDGGLLLVYCQCRDGVGSTTFLPWFEVGGFAEAFRQLVDRYEGNGGTALAMMEKTRRIRIGLVTGLDDRTCRLIGVERWQHEEVRGHLAGLGGEGNIACIANASLLVRTGSPNNSPYARQSPPQSPAY
jgi:nickel-dependent lactate racemase